MLHLLAKNWWVFVIRGILAILFGIGAFVVPGVTLAALVIIAAMTTPSRSGSATGRD